MAEYIEREAVMQKFADHVKRSNNSDFAPPPTWNQAVQIIEDCPAADVQPVVHGHWVRCKTNIGLYQCSECHFPEHEQYGILGNYCRNCGARMDEDETTAL